MFGFDAPTALLLLLAGFAAVAFLSMRRLGRFGTGDDAGSPDGRRPVADRRSLLIGGLVILAAVAGAVVLLGLWP